MGMSCFFVETWLFIIKVSCFSVHFCPQLSLIPCFVCICLHILQIFVWFCVVRCSLWHAVPESSWSFNAILRCFLRAVYGNVVFSRSKMDAHHKSLMFCMYVRIFCTYLCDSVLVRCSLWQAVPESS